MRREFLRELLSSVVIALGCLSFLSLLFYFLALHDIYHDYASPEILSKAAISTAPGWASCSLEWGILQAGFLLMLVFHVLFFFALAVRPKRWIV